MVVEGGAREDERLEAKERRAAREGWGLRSAHGCGVGGAQVTRAFRDLVEATYPEAVGRRRAEEAKALATAELHELVPPGGVSGVTDAALVQVGALRRTERSSLVCCSPKPPPPLGTPLGSSCEPEGSAQRGDGGERWKVRLTAAGLVQDPISTGRVGPLTLGSMLLCLYPSPRNVGSPGTRGATCASPRLARDALSRTLCQSP